MKRILIILIVFFAVTVSATAKDRLIKGTITDVEGFPLIGATVIITGTSIGTTSDVKGQFTLSVSERAKTIDVRYIGYDPQKITIPKTNTNLEIILNESINQLQEVVSIGYGTQTKANLTGAAQTANLSDVQMRAVTSTDAVLQGKIAGVQMVQNSAQPGNDNMEIRIRGVASVDNNSSPLVIIDGVEGDINSVNPRDIKSISVLKDASSSAIYGNRAAGGVIIIETKDGERGLKISYNNSISGQFPTRLPTPINDPVQWIDLTNEAFMNSTGKIKYSQSIRDSWANGTIGQEPEDWKKIVYQNGFMQKHYVSLSGAGNGYDFAFSGGYKNQTGVIYSTKADGYDFRVKANTYFFNKKLTIGANISGNDSKNHEAQSIGTMMLAYISSRPLLFFKGEENGETVYGPNADAFAMETLGGGNDRRTANLNTTFNVAVVPVKGLTLKGMYNFNNGNNSYTQYVPRYGEASNVELTTITYRRSSLTERYDLSRRWTFNGVATYNLKVKKHKIDLLAGYEMKENIAKWDQTNVFDLTTNKPVIKYGDPNTIDVDGGSYELAEMSTFGRVSYNFDNRYLFEGNFRYDGTSRFQKGRRFAPYFSTAAAWRISQEKFMKKIKWINNLKLRASYGSLGNAAISGSYYTFANNVATDQTYSFGGTKVNGSGIYTWANPYTSWEEIEMTNFGVDFDFLRGFSITVDAFQKDTKNMLSKLYPPLSLGTGLIGAPQNVGHMRNSGIEFTLNYNKRFDNGIMLTVGGNIAYVKNKIISLGENNKDFWHTTSGLVRSEVGYPFQSIYGYDCTGLYQVDDFTWQNNSDVSIPHMERKYVLKDGRQTTTLHSDLRPGDLMLRDINGDNTIDANDIVRLGKGRSDLSFGLNFTASWKGFDVQLLAQGQGEGIAYLNRQSPASTAFIGQIWENFATERWTEQSTQYRTLYADKQRAAIVSSYDMHNTAYLRLKNAQVGYTFQSRSLKKLKLTSLRVFVTGENLLTLTNFPKDFDPERAVNNNTVNVYPLIKSISGGLVLNF